MLEESIAELTKAVLALTYALNQHPAVASPVVVREVTHGSAQTFDSEQEMVEAITGQKTEVPNEKPKTTTDTSPPSESESKAVSYDDVKKATNALSAAKGRDATIAVLSRFGAKKATELDAAQWAEYIKHAGKVTEGADV